MMDLSLVKVQAMENKSIQNESCDKLFLLVQSSDARVVT